MIHLRIRALQVILAGLLITIPSAYGINSVTVTQTTDGILVKTGQDQIQITVCGPSEFHIIGGVTGPEPSSTHTPWIVRQCASKQFVLNQDAKVATLSTATLQVRIALDSGTLSFATKAGENLLSEGARPRSYEPLGLPQDHI